MTDKMILRTTLTSPFGRKVRMAAEVLGLATRIKIVPANTRDETDTLRHQNPLGKIPCLLLPDGTAFFDSRVIIEFLDMLEGQPSLVPASGIDRFRVLTRATLFDGVTDAALLLVYERRFRKEKQVSEPWLDHQRGKVFRGLKAAASELPDPTRTDITSIGLACALGYLDWRRPVEWRERFSIIAEWLEAFSANEPAYAATECPTENAA